MDQDVGSGAEGDERGATGGRDGGSGPERRLYELSYDECLARLGEAELGRLAVMVGHYPQIFTVNYRLDQMVVVFRTNIGTKLLAANHDNVAFQVDHVDPVSRTGWSVLVQGMAEDVTDRQGDVTAERSRQLGVDPWAPGERSRLVRIVPAHISGRQISPGDFDFWADDRGYV